MEPALREGLPDAEIRLLTLGLDSPPQPGRTQSTIRLTKER